MRHLIILSVIILRPLDSSFHKKSTRNFLLKLIREDWGFPESEVVAEMKFDIPKSYNFHKAKTMDVEVDLIRIFVGGDNNVEALEEATQKITLDTENNPGEEFQSKNDEGKDGEDVSDLS